MDTAGTEQVSHPKLRHSRLRPIASQPANGHPTSHPQFMALHSIYIKSGDGFILVFSLTSMESVGELQSIREQIMRMKAGDGARVSHVPPVLLL